MEEFKLDMGQNRKNPYDNANIFSRIFFCWLLPLFVKGYKRALGEDDIYEHRPIHDSKKLGDKLEKNWIKELARNKYPSLTKALAATFLFELLIINIFILLQEVLRVSQPLLLTKLVLIFDEDRVEEDRNKINLFAGLIILDVLLSTILKHNYYLAIMQVAIKFRIAACSLIYRKSLKLSKSSLAETTIGQMVNLLTNDVTRFDMGIYYLHNLYIAPVELFIVMYLLYANLGWRALSGSMLMFIFIPFQSWLGKKTSEFRLSTATKTDERVRLINEIISSIQVIKMYTWETPFTKLINIERSEEMQYIKKTSVIRSLVSASNIALNKCAIAVCILVFVVTGNTLTASYAYAVTSYFRLLHTLTYYFPFAVNYFSEMAVSVKRIEAFLMYDEVKVEQKCLNQKESYIVKCEFNIEDDIGIHIKNASCKWLKSSSTNTLQDINIDVTSNNIAAIIGPVGSGKTTLFHLILKELEPQSGFIKVKGVISYASQEPWVFAASLRENILFGQKFDQNKYEEVLKICALHKDIALFSHGDRTLLGERGIKLSGGQKARVNLARAIYKDADIYLLDDPLSAVDTHVGKQLFEDCICSYLRKKCVVLITHQIHYLKEIDNIFLINYGRIEDSGSYSYLKNSNNVFTKIFSEIEEEEANITKPNKLLPSDEKMDENADIEILQREEKSSGNVSNRVYLNFINSGGSFTKFFGLVLIFIGSQCFESFTDYYLTFWVNIEHLKSSRQNCSLSRNFTMNEIKKCGKIIEKSSYDGWWLTPLFSNENTVFYYNILMIILICIIAYRSISFYKWFLTSSTNMHNTMFINIIYSPMRFFNSHPSGRILNRFSKDIGTVDETLPVTLLDAVETALAIFSCAIIIGSLTLWVYIPTFIIAILCYIIRVIYAKTSRDIKRLDSITRSPIYTHLSASLQGITTIRAFAAQDMLQKEFDNFQNVNSAAYFTCIGASRTFGFWLDLLCVIYVTLVIGALLFIKSETFGGNMGLALSQLINLNVVFQWGIRQWTEFENQMTSVERIQEYADLKQEEDIIVEKPDENWPQKGLIVFKNLSLRYGFEDPYVLKKLNLTIRPKQKIGIVGRTGAGKSSIIQALFRLAPIDGSILIDGIDTKTVTLKQLRSNISIIPQEPVLFSDTFRKNLDPFNEYDDNILWNALKEVELKQVIDNLDGLDTKISEGGANFSAGQRQLVCLARALVRKNKILVLDEATANVDPQTESLIQKAITEKFTDFTVLTIAHRLHSIIDSDKVLVMDDGEAKEFDHPHKLLQKENGIFYSLVANTGKATAQTLKSTAKENYKNRSRIFN